EDGRVSGEGARNELRDVALRLVVLRQNEKRKAVAHQRHRSMAHFGRGESFSVERARFLELERCLLRRAEAEAAADDVEVTRGDELLRGDRPVERPRLLKEQGK